MKKNTYHWAAMLYYFIYIIILKMFWVQMRFSMAVCSTAVLADAHVHGTLPVNFYRQNNTLITFFCLHFQRAARYNITILVYCWSFRSLCVSVCVCICGSFYLSPCYKRARADMRLCAVF